MKKIAIVTGANRGIGLELCRQLQNSYQVIACCRQASEDLQKSEVKILEGLDVTQSDAPKKILAGLGSQKIDLLINNAGILRDKSFMKMPLDDFEEVMRVHLLGSVYLTKAAFPFMREANYGRILFTTSAAGLYGNFGQTNYAAAKLGLVGFMNALKLEGEKYGITVNTISPIAATGMGEGTFPGEISDRIKPEWVAAMAVYLVSDQCRVTGRILSAGGGYYSSAQIYEAKGVRFENSEPATVEHIAERFSDIISMDGSRHYENATENVLHILSPIVGNGRNPGE